MRRLELIDLRRSFGDVVALDDVCLAIEEGEHVAILGPSGSGKSTLMRLVAGLDIPDSGDVIMDGVSQRDLPPHRRDVAMVFQQFALYPHLTVMKNITMGLRHGQSLSGTEATTRATEVLRMLGLAAFASRRPAQLSGGQRQRVGLARALARRAGVILLDEPLSGLDAQLRVNLRSEISSSLRATGATVLHVTHDQADAMAGSDRLAVVDGGRLRQVGTPEELYRSPTDLFTARFIGVPAMNVYPLDPTGEGTLRWSFGRHVPASEAGEVGWAGIRPERLRFDNRGPWTTSGVVTGSELTGADYIVYVAIEGHVTAVRTADRPAPVGGVVPLSVAAEDVHLFDRETERRIGNGSLISAPTEQLLTTGGVR